MARKIENIGDIVQTNYHRNEEYRNRTKVTIANANLAVTDTAILLKTITTNTTFYMTDLIITYNNTNIAQIGNIQIRDDGTLKVPFLTRAGGNENTFVLSKSWKIEPEFVNNIEIIAPTGTVNLSIHIMGYEEINE